MSFRGNLKTLALSDILQTLAMNTQSGVLRLVRRPGGTVRLVHFENGEVRNAARGAAVRAARGESPEKAAKSEELPPLVAYFVGRCLLTAEQASALAKQLAGSEGTAAKLVSELGYAPGEQVAHLVKRFTEEEVYDLFTWEDADFEFTDGAPAAGTFTGDAPACAVRVPTASLVMEAARRIDEWGRFRQTLPSARELLVASGPDPAGQPPPADDGLDPVMRRLLALADGTRDIEDLIADSWLSRYEVGGILCFLLEAGKLRNAAQADLERALPALTRAQNWPRSVKVLERLVALGKDTPEVRARLAEAAAKAGDPERAAIHLGVLADRAIEQGREGQAVEIWQRILEHQPRNARAHQGLAEHYQRKGRREDSLKHYTALVRAQSAAGAHDRAVAAARAALEIDQADLQVRTLLAEALVAGGRGAEAADEFERLAGNLSGSGNARGACEALRRALQIEPGRLEARKRLTALASAADRKRHTVRRALSVTAALAALGAAGGGVAYNELKVAKPRFEQARAQAAGHLRAAEAATKAQSFDQAIAEYEKAREAYDPARDLWSLAGYGGQAEARRAECTRRIEDLRNAKAALEREVNRGSAQLRRDAEAGLEAGKLEETRAILQKLMEAGSEADQEYAHKQLALVDQCHAEIREAVKKSSSYRSEQEEFEAVRKLARRYPSHPDVQALTFPVRVETDPPGVEARLNDGAPALTPCTVRPSVAGPNRLKLARRGYREAQLTLSLAEIPAARTVRAALARVPAWTARVDAAVEAPITLVPERAQIVFGDRAGTLWCLSARDGKPVWKRPLGALASVSAAAVVEGQTVYVSSFDSRLYAVDLADGAKDRWPPFKTDGLLRGAPRLATVQLLNNQSFLFAGSGDGRVYCLDARTGEPRWKSDKLGAVDGSVLVTPEAVYAASDDEHLHALAPADGRELWKHKLGAALRATPVLAAGIICLGADDGCLYAFDPARREVRWRQQAHGPVRAGPVVAGAQLYFASMEGELWALEPSESKPGVIRQWGLGAAVSAAPLVTPARVYVGSHDGVFHALDRSSEKEIWRFKTNDGAMRSAATFFDGLVIFGSDDGFVYAFDEK